jgi:hypothetical protein
VIARKDEHALGQHRMQFHRVEELRPFGRNAGVGHVAGDQDHIHRALLMNLFDAVEDPRETVIAARPAAAAFDPKSIALTDQMNV